MRIPNCFYLRAMVLALLVVQCVCGACAANDWDERLEGTLPLPANYTLEISDPGSGVTSVTCDTGEVALHLDDYDPARKPGRINRGNWSNVSGYTLHTRFRVLSGNSNMTLQINDGPAEGRLALRWDNGYLYIQQVTPDAGQPSSIALAANTWIEIWVKVLNHRYWLYTFSGGVWNLYSVGSTAAGSGGAVYIGASSNPLLGSMDLDFWRLETTGGYAPNEANAPCVPPSTGLAVGALADPIVSGQSTSITVAASESGVDYQLRKSPGDVNVGSPVHGTGGTINLPTGLLTSTTTFNVLATSVSGGCSARIAQTRTITVATSVSSIAEAKSYPDGTVVQLSGKVVSASTPTAYWLQEPTRECGIRVNSTSLPTPGRSMTVTGTLATTDGDRRIDCLDYSAGSTGGAPNPLGMGLLALGGRALNAYSPGVEGASGPNSIGLLVRVWGKVTALGDDYYYVDDGSGLSDGTSTAGTPNVGVRVLAAPGSIAVGDFARLTGINTSFSNQASQIQRAVLPIASDCVLPDAGLDVGALDSVVCSGGSTSITVAGSQIGVTYQLRSGPGNTSVGAPVSGTGGVINLPTGPIASTTTFNVLAVRVVGGCAVQLAQTKTIAANPLPDAGLTVGALANPVFPNESATIFVRSSQSDVIYQLRNDADNSLVGDPVMGNGATVYLPTGPLSTGAAYNILATRISTGCSVQLATTKVITVGSRSKIGFHVVCCRSDYPNYVPYLHTVSDAEKPCRLVYVIDDWSSAALAKQANPATVTIGRVKGGTGYNMEGMDYLVEAGYTPQQGAAWYYEKVKPIWEANRANIDIWECTNEWSWWWAWQADFFIELMNLAEPDGFRIGMFSCSYGNPPEAYWPDFARACARAKAHGNHILTLHEYSPSGLLMDEYARSGDNIVLRYRRLYNYLAQNNAVCPLALTEVGENSGGGFPGINPFVTDFAWYDSKMREDSYVIGCAAWGLTSDGGININPALPSLANYVITH